MPSSVLFLQEVVVTRQLLLLVHLTVELVDTRAVAVGVTTESHVQALQEAVATGDQGLRGLGASIDGGLSVEDNDTVSQVGGHDEIVLDDEGSLLGVHDETLDDTGGDNTLLGIQVGGRLVNQVEVGGHTQSQDNGDTLQFTTGQVLNFLVDEIVKLERLVDIGLELGRQESGLDTLEEELTNSTLELGSDLLGLHADVHLGDLGGAVWLDGTSQHLTESGLSGTVLTHHDENLGVGEVTGLDAEVEVTLGLLHGGVGESAVLVDNEIVTSFGETESEGVLTESQVLGGNVTVQEDVDTFTDRRGQSHNTIDSGTTIEHANEVGKVIKNRQIVLNNDNIVIRAEQATDSTGSSQTLLDIEIRGRFVKHVSAGVY